MSSAAAAAPLGVGCGVADGAGDGVAASSPAVSARPAGEAFGDAAAEALGDGSTLVVTEGADGLAVGVTWGLPGCASRTSRKRSCAVVARLRMELRLPPGTDTTTLLPCVTTSASAT